MRKTSHLLVTPLLVKKFEVTHVCSAGGEPVDKQELYFANGLMSDNYEPSLNSVLVSALNLGLPKDFIGSCAPSHGDMHSFYRLYPIQFQLR